MKNGVKREILYFVSGVMWSGVGIMLNVLSFGWFDQITGKGRYFSLSAGFLSGIAMAIFGFGFLAKKNINRIHKLADYTCIFNFQELKSYFIIIFMIALGVFMRKSGIFPKELLIFVYTTIGSGLLFASFLYFREFFSNFKEIKVSSEE